MKKRINLILAAVFILVVVLMLSILMLSSFVSAIGVQLVCLRENEVLEFSECNPNIDDKICENDLCQLCVNEVRRGIYCPENMNSCNNAGISTCDFIHDEPIDLPEQPPEDEELPVITLNSPIDNYQGEEGAISFKFSATLSYQLNLCDLIINNEVAATKVAPIKLSSNIITYSLETGRYSWKIKCITSKERGSSGEYAVESETREIIIGEPDDEPNENENLSIELINVTNGWSAAGTQDVSFSYKISQTTNLSQIQQCSLVLNDAAVSVTNDITNYESSFIYRVSPATYSWKISCKKGLIDLVSETRNFTITSLPDTNQNDNSGNSGSNSGSSSSSNSGSGGGLIYTNDNTETKKETKEETQGNEGTLNTENTTTESKTPITGAVIGALKKSKIPLALSFIIIIVFVATMSYFRNGKKKIKGKIKSKKKFLHQRKVVR